MDEPNLVSISLSAFTAVLVLLSFLALVIRGIAYLFQERSAATVSAPEPSARAGDPALLAALHAATHQRFPGHRITTVEETTTGSQR